MREIKFRVWDRSDRVWIRVPFNVYWNDASAVTVRYKTSEGFDRVLVVESGRIVEDGDPLHLAQMLSSRYRRLLQTQEHMQNRLAASTDWKRIRLESGRIVSDHVRSNEQTA